MQPPERWIFSKGFDLVPSLSHPWIPGFSILLPGRYECLATALEMRGRTELHKTIGQKKSDPGFHPVVLGEPPPIPEPQFPQLKNGTEIQKITQTDLAKLNGSQQKIDRHVRRRCPGRRRDGHESRVCECVCEMVEEQSY